MLNTLVLVLAAVSATVSCANQNEHVSVPGRSDDMRAVIPESMRVEHSEIHGELVLATKEPGRVGEAARQLASVLHPHFVREEEIALPPLGALRRLAMGEPIPETSSVLTMTDALRAELPRMLQEHVAIGALARRLEQTAREEGNLQVEALAKKLQLHARSEEEIFYPAAILVGDVIRSRMR